MYKRGAVLSLMFALAFAYSVNVSAQTDDEVVAKCGFFANIFGRCDQSANALEGRLSSSSKASSSRDRKITNISAESIACVGTAVATRENSLSSGMSTYSQSVNSAYTKRATDLATAYSQTTGEAVKTGVKSAWSGFASTTKTAKRSWKNTRDNAWKTFKTSVKACKASTSITDASNSITEVSGD